MEEAIGFLEGEMKVEAVEFIEKDDRGFHFTGFMDGQEVEVLMTETNHVFVDGKPVDVYLPFNVWSLKVAEV